MKKVKILIATLVVLGLNGCSDFLSETPDNRTQLDSAEKISELLVNAYPGRTYMAFTESMTDNFDDSRRLDNTDLTNSRYYRFEDNMLAEFDSPSWYWESCYSAIAHSNQALEAIELEGNPASLAAQKGEALMTRAYAHFMLVNIFSQSYDPSTAASEMGVPYVDQVEKNLIVNYKRKSIQEVYDLIEADLVQGLELVQDKYKKKGFHFTRPAAKAFAVKFYAAKADWDKVLEYSADLGDNPTKLRNVTALVTSGLGIPERGQRWADANEDNNLLVVAGNSSLPYGLGIGRFGVTDDLRAYLDKSHNPFGKVWDYSKMWIQYGSSGTLLPSKFYMYFVYEGGNTTSGIPYVATVALSNDEMYLSRIEATIMKGNLDLAAKMIAHFAKDKTGGFVASDINKVTRASILTAVPSASEYEAFFTMSTEQQKFMKFVAEMRRSAFAGEGARWFDIKRFNLEVRHRLLVENEVIVLNKRDNRKAIQVPAQVSQYGVVPNPR